jgi:3-dehydroquinate synthase
VSSFEISQMQSGCTPSRPYYLGDNIRELFPEYLRHYYFDEVYLVTSEQLNARFGRSLAQTLGEADIPVNVLTIKEGELSKTWDTLSDLCERLVLAGVTKDSIIVAMGGGVISNIVGLAAALIYRGLRYVEVPTTMLNLTDGTLSNKQAINGAGGKNQFGTYYAPIFIWADVSYVRHEPLRQLKSAVTEAVKNGLIDDAEWFAHLSTVLNPTLDYVYDDLAGFCRDVVQSKLSVLRRDSTERGECIILEYGHTVGHAVEFLANGRLLHGEAVGIGMCAAARVGIRMGITPPEALFHHEQVLRAMESPIEAPREFEAEQILGVIIADNKRRGGDDPRLILLDDVGTVHSVDGDFETPVPQPLLKSVLAER